MSLAPVTTATQTVASAADQSGTAALGPLATNYTTFLRMLMTQLQNQDPTSPMDTNDFTRELVQFSAVEQQIRTNTSLTRLIELTQAGEIMQSSAMIGRQVTVESETIPLQSGQAGIRFTLTADASALVTVLTDKGVPVAQATLAGQRGANDWTWDGRDASGKQMPDGAYRVSVQAIGSDGKSTTVPYQVVGTATGVTTDSQGTRLVMGAVSVPFSAIRSVAR